MASPIPKERSTRRRRNVTPGARQLSTVHSTPTPKLPSGTKWHRQTRAWWKDVWASPMAPEYDHSDLHGLYLLAVLIDAFWVEPSKELAAEIRLQRQCFGLTPIDRRRLQWEVDRGEEAERNTRNRRAVNRPIAVEKDDPRRHLAG